MDNYYDTVRIILLENPRTRDDDMYLYSVFLAKFNLVRPEETFYEVMVSAKKRGLPSYESITRARRKVQEMEEYLRGEKRGARKEQEQKYREFYRR